VRNRLVNLQVTTPIEFLNPSGPHVPRQRHGRARSDARQHDPPRDLDRVTGLASPPQRSLNEAISYMRDRLARISVFERWLLWS
jgi:hypothetical protein